MVMDLDLLKLLLTGKLTIDAKFLWYNVKKIVSPAVCWRNLDSCWI